ncbi:hypothetical protein L0P88_10690 [Muricauda sp. SCSIO 64092]|uniref:hypothetical protein n=1 Tax=Allomuricauda sp. SCSIO 64092 TaxID=2908842 RepID=UPI001FF5AA4C|nr:hypothetical protein [Muricauda sp. SCSIO 64092]UOY08979.1 hypothetical protein L0P88_10690 [Muricauda sp. SCSIO 64092]
MKTKLSMAMAILLVQLVMGQEMDPNKMADYQNTIMIEQLDLSDSQKEQVKAINLKYSKKQAALLNKEGSMFSKMGDMKKIKKAKNEELEEVLSKEQMEIFENEIEPEMRKQMKRQRGS